MEFIMLKNIIKFFNLKKFRRKMGQQQFH